MKNDIPKDVPLTLQDCVYYACAKIRAHARIYHETIDDEDRKLM